MGIKATPDYVSAASRHRRDANFLFENKHHDNAAYIAGYVAECALKAIIEIAGRPPKVHNLAPNIDDQDAPHYPFHIAYDALLAGHRSLRDAAEILTNERFREFAAHLARRVGKSFNQKA
jgi:hypothetical protein